MSQEIVYCIKNRITILTLGIFSDSGSHYNYTADDVISMINKGQKSFHILKKGIKIHIIVASRSNGQEYLKSVEDDDIPTDLLSLPNRF